MPKATTPTGPRQARRHNPLEEDLLATGPLKTKAPKRKSKSNAEDGEGFVDADKILQLGRELAEEEEQLNAVPEKKYDAFAFDSRAGHVEGDDDANLYDDEEPWADEDDEVVEELEVDADDLETYNKFMREQEDPLLEHGWDGFAKESEQGPPTNLADIILAKIAAHESGMGSRQQAPGPVDEDVELNPKVVEVYTKIGEILSRYKSGKIPKPMKILPTIPNWEMILEITRPELWTANACYEITRIFCSGKPLVAQRFLEMVILDRVRDEIHETKKLGPHLFKALKKGLYKPSAWFKGILFPLVASGTCTLREASIVSAALVRTSVPVLHSAAAIKGLCDIAAQEASAGTEGGGATNIFIKALLDKRYALPYQVIDALCFHFLRFRSVDPASVKETDDLSSAANGKATHTLPVIWHKTFLAFAERYRDEITEDQREALLDLLLTHGHHTIGAQIRRELLAGRGRGVPLEGEGAGFDGDDTMLVD